MNKQLTRKQFLMYVGSLIGVFVLSRLPGTSTKSAPVAHTYGGGSYGGSSTS
ncbi:MAG: hypothetical protein AB202_02445 [Parcubacteria bacterium C7867-007]|nr:MAG: hypothetical protein AB202_02445 [Parcubacteria bacterium C7867-007]